MFEYDSLLLWLPEILQEKRSSVELLLFYDAINTLCTELFLQNVWDVLSLLSLKIGLIIRAGLEDLI